MDMAARFSAFEFTADRGRGEAHVEHDALTPSTLRRWPRLRVLDITWVDLDEELLAALQGRWRPSFSVARSARSSSSTA